MRRMTFCLAFVLATACQQQRPSLTDADRAAIADTVKRMVMTLFDAANHRDASRFVSLYAADPDVHPVGNGAIYPSLEAFRAGADSFYQAIAAFDAKAGGEIRTMVLAPDAAATQVPLIFTVTTQSGKRVSGQGVYSALFQKRGGVWKIVRSHESDQHLDQLQQQIFGGH